VQDDCESGGPSSYSLDVAEVGELLDEVIGVEPWVGPSQERIKPRPQRQ
jgi:hypothetical protein